MTTWFKEKHHAPKTSAGVFSCNEKLLPGHPTNNRVGTNYYSQSKQRPLNSWQTVWALPWFALYALPFTYMILDPIGSSVLQECWGGALIPKVAHTFLIANDGHVGMGKETVPAASRHNLTMYFLGTTFGTWNGAEHSNFHGCSEEL